MRGEPDIVGILIAHYQAERDAEWGLMSMQEHGCPHGKGYPKDCTYCWEGVYVNSAIADEARAKRALEVALKDIDHRIGMDPLLNLSVKIRALADEAAMLYADGVNNGHG